MQRSTCLYYPWINPPASFIRTAVLFWDTIGTIVPAGVKPYQNDELKSLKDEGILLPVRVSPRSQTVRAVEGAALDYVQSPSARPLLEHLPEYQTARLYPEKLSHRLRHALQEAGVARETGRNLIVDRGFATFYMTILATEIAAEKAYAQVTDEALGHDFANHVRSGDQRVPNLFSPPYHRSRSRRVEMSTAAAILANMTIRTIGLHPSVPISKVIKFRKQHSSDIGRFRSAIFELVRELVQEGDEGDLRERCRAVFKNKVKPAISDMRKQLCLMRLRSELGALQIAAFGSGTLLTVPLLGPWSPLAGVGLSIVIGAGRYALDRREFLAKNPYSFLVAAGKKLT